MKKGITILLASSCSVAHSQSPPDAGPSPPVARREPHPTTLHGRTREDDYFWLRRKGTSEVEAYLKAENAYTDAMMAPTAPLQEKLYREMLSRLQETDTQVPHPKGGFWYYERTEEGKQYPIRCRKSGSLEAPERVLLDLNQLVQGPGFVGLGAFEVSVDGRRLAYSLDTTGFRVYRLHVKDLESGEIARDSIDRVDSVAWGADGRTLYHVTEDEAKRPSRLWKHVLGTDPARDELLYEEKDERFGAAVSLTRTGAWIVLTLASHTTSEVRVLRSDGSGGWRTIAPRRADHEYYLEDGGDVFYLRTNDRGRNYRLVTAPIADPSERNWKEALAHRPAVMLLDLDVFSRHLVRYERADGLPRLVVVDRASGAERPVATDEPAYSIRPGRNYEYDTDRYRYVYESFVTPESTYEAELRSGNRALLKRQPVLGGYDPSRYQVERLSATAADGTRVPISLVRRRDFQRDGKAPMLLYAYGSYGHSSEVDFRSGLFSLLDRGVSFAIAHIRGGGELGKGWHDAGRMMKKRYTFTDFIDCAEHLIRERYTAADRLAIQGGSAGGLLMGAVVNLRPELFKAVVAQVPFVDVVNTMLDESLPLTVGEFEEWGNPKIAEEFQYLLSYSPYDNVRAQAYPAMLVKSAYNDSQVMYFEPAKWVARLRALKTDQNPLLLRLDMDPAGHGGKSGRYERIREAAFVYAFILRQLGIGD